MADEESKKQPSRRDFLRRVANLAMLGTSAALVGKVLSSDNQNTKDRKLLLAIEARDYSAVEGALAAGADPNTNVRVGVGKPSEKPLIAAASNDEYEMVKQLLSAGADANSLDNKGRTALYSIAIDGGLHKRRGMLEQLIAPDPVKGKEIKGVDVNHQDKRGNTILHHRSKITSSPLGSALVDLDNTQFLIDKGAQVNTQNHNGDTALSIVAAKPGGADTVRLLIENGAEVNIPNKQGERALDRAVIAHHMFIKPMYPIKDTTEKIQDALAVIAELVENGAECNSENKRMLADIVQAAKSKGIAVNDAVSGAAASPESEISEVNEVGTNASFTKTVEGVDEPTR